MADLQRSLDLRVDSFSCFSRAKSSPIIRIPQLLQVNKGSSENPPAKMKARWKRFKDNSELRSWLSNSTYNLLCVYICILTLWLSLKTNGKPGPGSESYSVFANFCGHLHQSPLLQSCTRTLQSTINWPLACSLQSTINWPLAWPETQETKPRLQLRDHPL